MFCKTLALLFVLHYVSEIGASCRDGYCYNFEADVWLKLHEVPAKWSDAKNLCRDEGAIIASPLTKQLKNAILSYLSDQDQKVDTIFTGVHTTYSKGVYTSFEGVRLTELDITWAPGEPNNYQNSESCLVMKSGDRRTHGTMGDANCNSVYPFVCYKKHITQEITTCGDPEYNYNTVTKKCYKFHRYGRMWDDAYRTCYSEGGHLAIVNSEQEYYVIRDLINDNPANTLFTQHTSFVALGFSDPNDGGSWITVHGESLKEAGYERWASGEPNNASQPWGELCGVASRGNGDWYDMPCFWSFAFICEKEPHRLITAHTHLPTEPRKASAPAGSLVTAEALG